MSNPPLHTFPLTKALLVLTGVALASGVLALLVVGMIDDTQPARRATLVMAGVSWVACVLGILPVAILGPLGVMPTIFAYFGGAAARVVMSLLAAIAAVQVARLPALPVAAALMTMYLPLLFVEVGFVGKYLWAKDFLAPREAGSGSLGAPAGAGNAGASAKPSVDSTFASSAAPARDELHAMQPKVTA